VLVLYESRSIFRHSTVAKFSVVFMDDLDTEYKISNGEEIQLCKFSPSGDGLIYIKDNTIFHATDANIKAETKALVSLTGEDGVIYYGIPDWVYEEEVLGSDAAAWFSSNGKYLAYASFDDSNVKEFLYELYGDGKEEYQYPKEVHLRYPKVGESNPSVALMLNDLITNDPFLLQLNYPPSVSNDHILGTVFWISDTKLGAIWLNRRQNFGVFVAYSADSNWDMEEVIKF
jgi:dipeptidyl-peptidase-4